MIMIIQKFNCTLVLDDMHLFIDYITQESGLIVFDILQSIDRKHWHVLKVKYL